MTFQKETMTQAIRSSSDVQIVHATNANIYTAAKDSVGKKVLTMDDCKYCQDEICVNADCPMCCDFCPVVDVPGVCRFEEREERNEQS